MPLCFQEGDKISDINLEELQDNAKFFGGEFLKDDNRNVIFEENLSDLCLVA